MIRSVKSQDYNMYNFLTTLKATIPTYQRSYEWGADQINDFLEDLQSEVNRPDDSNAQYFFGPVITTSDQDGKKQIIDGQQRLTTSTIFLAVIRDLLGQYKSNTDANKLKFRIIENLIGDGSKYSQYRLTQVGIIADYFRNNIQVYDEERPVEAQKIFTGHGSKGMGKVNNIIRAYNQILNFFQEKLEKKNSEEDKVELLDTFFDVFVNHFFIVEIWAPNRSEAFHIFQTVNARGLDLTAADLIKSDFFGNSGDYTEEIIDMWEGVEETIGDLNYSVFIRYSWNSINQFTTARRLYKSVSEKINDPDKIFQFMKMLQKLSPAYAELNGDPDISYLSDSYTAERIRNILQELNALNFKTYFPIYLAMINRDYSEESILKIMLKVTSILIRNKIGAKGTNWIEKLLSHLGHIINSSDKSESETVDLVIHKIVEETESSDTVKGLLQAYDFSKDARLIRFILRGIENESLGEKGLVPIDNNKVHIEHIMPRTPLSFEDWDVTEESHEEFLWKLGNMTLWLDSKNTSLKNSNFDEKRKVYKESDIEMTREINKYKKWNAEKINQRTNELIDRFIELY